MELARVGVVGCGVMGSGIAQLCVSHGFDVLVSESDEDLLQVGLNSVRARLARDVERNRLTQERYERALSRLQGSTTLHDLAECQIVIEAITEDQGAKTAMFARLGEECGPTTVLASNTSSISLSALAGASRRPENVIGLHFFNPPTVLRLVEVIPSEMTSAETVEKTMAFCDAIDRLSVRVKDTPGFIVNRLLIPFIFDAIRLVETGAATAGDVDQACKVGLNHAMGPLATADLIGLDTLINISDVMFEEYGEPRFKAPTMLRRMVSLGTLGRKSSQGFFSYSGENTGVSSLRT